MALRLGGARSVMNSYAEIDGVPVAADRGLLTGLLRDEWGFAGTVVADYFAVRFLQTLHGVAGGRRRRGRGSPCGPASTSSCRPWTPSARRWSRRSRRGEVDEALVDRALRRVLTQKIELGLLDADWQALPDDVASPAPRRRGQPGHRRCAWPGSRSCCCATRRRPAAAPRHRGSRWSARSPTTRWPCSAATRSPRTWASATPTTGSAWTSPRCATALARRVPDAHLRAGVRHHRRRHLGHRRPRSPRPPPPTCACSPSATGPDCSAGAPPARAATPSTCDCPACRPNSSARCWPPAPRWSWCC